MDARSYAGVSEEEFAIFVRTYRELSSKTPWIHVFLYADTLAKGVLFSSWLETLSGRPLAPLALTAAGLPLLIYYVTFCRLPPPVTPRTFRRLLLFVMAWCSAGTFVLFVLALIAHLSAATLATSLNLPMLVSMRASLFVLPTLLKYHNKLEQQEGKVPSSRTI